MEIKSRNVSSNIDSFQFVSFVQINIQNQITIQNYLCDISVLNDDFEERVSKLIQSSLSFWWVFFPSKNITAIAFDLNVQWSTRTIIDLRESNERNEYSIVRISGSNSVSFFDFYNIAKKFTPFIIYFYIFKHW